MATESVAIEVTEPQGEPLEAITASYITSGWKESGLPMGVKNRLSRAECCIAGIVTLNRMLMADKLGKEDAADHPDVQFGAALSSSCIDGLNLALQELGASAADLLDEIRNNAYVTISKAH